MDSNLDSNDSELTSSELAELVTDAEIEAAVDIKRFFDNQLAFLG